MRFVAPSLLLLLVATAPALPNGARQEQRQRAQAEAGDEIILYRTKGGESLQAIAAKWFVRPEDWRRLQALNKIKDPADIPAGTALRLRSTWLKTNPITAELAAFRGNVQVVRGTEARPVMKGMELSEGDIIETGPNGFATLVLPDASHVSLPSSSRIRLARLRQVPMSDSIDRRFTLEQGRSEAKVTPMTNPASRFLITTPVAVAAVRGTQFRVTYTPSELKAVTEVTEGKVAVSRFSSSDEVLVRAGYGAIATSTSLSRPYALLSAPSVETPERLQNRKTVTFQVKPVVGADRYLVEIASDAGFLDRVGSTETRGTLAEFEGVPSGHYFVRAFAVDALGLVGKPSQYAFERIYADTVAQDGSKSSSKQAEQLATLGDPGPKDYAWFEGDSGTLNLVDSGGDGFADLAGGPIGQTERNGDAGPVVPLEEVANLLGDEPRPFWPGGGNGTRFGGGGFSGGGSGGGGGGRPSQNGGDGNAGNPDTGGQPGNSGNSGNNGVPGNGGNSGNGNLPQDRPDNGNTPGGGNVGEPGNPGESGSGNLPQDRPDNGNTPGGGNVGEPGNPGQPGNPGNGANPGQGGLPGNTGNPGVNPDKGNPDPGGSDGGGTGDTGGPGDTGGVVIIPVDPAPPPPPPSGGNPGGDKGIPPTAPPSGGNTPVVPAPIPEPASWAMMIVGFGLIGGFLRRRRPASA